MRAEHYHLIGLYELYSGSGADPREEGTRVDNNNIIVPKNTTWRGTQQQTCGARPAHVMEAVHPHPVTPPLPSTRSPYSHGQHHHLHHRHHHQQPSHNRRFSIAPSSPLPPPPALPPPTSEETLTCPSCRVSIPARVAGRHRDSSEVRRICPYCGAAYFDEENEAEGFGDMAGDDDVSSSNLRLPIIEPMESSTRYASLGTIVANRLSNVGLGIANLGNLFLRPGSNTSLTSLPPIAKPDTEDHHLLSISSSSSPTLASSPASAPGPNLQQRKDSISYRRNAQSMDNLATSVDGDNNSNVKDKPVYPIRNKTRESFLRDVRRALQTGNYGELQRFYMQTFDSFAEICATFKQNPTDETLKVEDPALKVEFLYAVHDALKGMPSLIHKTVMRSIINALLDEKVRLYRKDNVRALFILLQNPVFAAQSSYTIFAHLMRSITHLSNSDHQLMVHWFKCLEVDKLRMMVRHVTQFVSIRQFPPADKSLPPLSKSRWWIPTGVRVLALINAANNSCTPNLLHYTEFYNSSLDHLDLMQDYYSWQNPDRPGHFAYCQYPFVLSIVAKRIILTKDSEQQMILTARRSLVAKVARHQTPQIDIFFLNINVRRSHLVSDSLNEIATKQKDLKKKLKVSFVGEPGLDMGGLTKEWFLLLIRQIFQPDYGMFVYYPNSRSYWFSTAQDGNLREYNLIGVLMGLAVYNSTILDLHFPSICYRKLLAPPVVPPSSSMPVGIVKGLAVEDLAEIMPDVAKGLKELLEYEGNVEEDMCMSFQVSLEEYGEMRTHDLKERGESISVTNETREEYVELYLDWVLNTAIYEQFRAFFLGFHSVCASNALIMLRPEEVEMLVCGCPTLDLQELRKVTDYDGYKFDDKIIKEFWEVITSLSDELQKKFLLFATGSDRIPVGGMSEMMFKITRMKDRPENLPEAHTCFNQLILPEYTDKDVLREKLIIAISNAEGFGLE